MPDDTPTAAQLAYEAWVLRTEGQDDTAVLARLAYEAYIECAAPDLELPWEQLTPCNRRAWGVVVRTMRLHDRAQATREAYTQVVVSRETGWFPWIAQDARDINHTPYAYLQVEIARKEWVSSQLVDPRALNPLTNAVDLWWRPVEDTPHA